MSTSFAFQDELNRVKGSFSESKTEKETREMELQRFREMYEKEVQLREKLAEKLYRASDKASKAQML